MIAIISLLLAVIIPLTIWLWKSFALGPELTIELKIDGSSSSPIGYSNKNIAVDGIIEMRDAIQIFRLQWEINFVITNNSEYTAYYPRIKFESTQPPFLRIQQLNDLTPISSKESVIIKAVFQEIEEAKGAERNNLTVLPANLKDIRILLAYKNSSKSIFYTLYENVNKLNTFRRIKPKGFD